MIERARFQALRRGVGRGRELRRVERFKPILPSEEHADVRTVKLVRRAREEIASDGSHVDQVVRRVVDGVHEGERPDLSCASVRGTSHVAHRAEGVRRRADRHEPGLRRERTLERRPIELPRLEQQRDRADRDPTLASEGRPGRDVGMVVELGNHDLVARPPAPTERARKMEREGRHVGAKHDLGG